MHENVWEWCVGWYWPAFYRDGGTIDPLCSDGKQKHWVPQGGSSAYRNHNPPDLQTHFYGFWVVFTVD